MEKHRAELLQLGSRIRDNIREFVLSDSEEKVLEDLRQRLVLSLSFVVPLLLITALAGETLWGLALEIALLLPILFVNRRVFIDGISAFYSRKPEKNTLAAMGTILAIAVMQFATAGIFLTTMALCRWSEAYVRCKLDDHLKQLMEAEPTDPQLRPGDIITVPKGEIIPADGSIVEGTSAIDEELITGERVPPEKGPGRPAFAGTRNLSAEIKVEVSRCGQDATISRIIDHITVSVATRPPIAENAERTGRIFVFAVIVVAWLAGIFWAAYGVGAVNAAMTAVTILIIASPYAFSVGIPMSILAATVRGAKNGILIRSADILELARDINTIAMNKTGTITGGEPKISDVVQLAGGFTLRLAGALEAGAQHPAGREIHRAALEKYGQLPAAEMEYLPGRGLKGTLEGRAYFGGSAAFMEENGISVNLPEADPLFAQGKSVVFFADESRVIGLIALRDAPKAVSTKAISRIEGMGIDAVMLTGDSERTAHAIRGEVGIDQAFAGIRPSEKAAVIEALRAGGSTGAMQDGTQGRPADTAKLVAMVGDGADDAAAIAKADLGIAIGTGPDIAGLAADVILIENDLMDVVRAISLSRMTIRFIRQDIAFAYIYNILAILAAATVLVHLAGPVAAPVIAALCMCASQVLVVASTLRIKTTNL